ncbi:hypothetical protein QBC32DRAFT_326366 [Pseudoneurospora amorphoporcata]|uniref:NACHT domain-containing protein n=1 Tax=Pseudoneurospora amorphoporcata TaxID=241081 RepID=A0AAN6SDE7_9PEZI|nr:hypothetical protein QBC32DRAFT_326366 [Pseudoneurospora amorphoporcata]
MSPRPDSFQRALDRFKKNLNPKHAQAFLASTREDVYLEMEKIQDEQGPNGQLRDLQCLEPFLEAMTQLGTVIEVFTNTTVFLCFVWGPIKLLLATAKTHLESLNKLLDAYGEIACIFPGLLHYQATFEHYQPLDNVLEALYSDILIFHEKALQVFSRPKWKMMFKAAWKTFESDFGQILHSLRERRKLLDSEKGSAALYEIQQMNRKIGHLQKDQIENEAAARRERHARRIESINRRLGPPEYQEDYLSCINPRDIPNGVKSSPGQWFSADLRYQAWQNSNAPETQVLYIHGAPGSGKSTLMAATIQRLLGNKMPDMAITFFFFRHLQEDKHNLNGLLRAVLAQLLDRYPDLATTLEEEISKKDTLTLQKTDELKGLVGKAIEAFQVVFLVLDGLDECADGEAENTINWLVSLGNGSIGCKLRILCAGQRDGVSDRRLLSLPSTVSLSLDEEIKHHEDIISYCKAWGKKIQRQFEAEHGLEQDIVARVSAGAKGMFLYAKLVLHHLFNQDSIAALEEQLEPGVFPDSLEKAYEKVEHRVFTDSSPPKRKAATKILSYVVCSMRTLRWREIQAFFCTDVINGEANYKRRLAWSYKELCSSFLDSDTIRDNYAGPEDEIRLVHKTAREFLKRRRRVDIAQQTAELSVFCCQYLTSPPFTLGISEEDVLSHAKKGYYALQDYTVQYWFDHLLECVKSLDPVLDGGKCRVVFSFALVFLKSYGKREKMAELLQAGTYAQLAEAIKKHLPTHGRERNSYFSIDIRTESLRQKIAQLDFEAFTVEEQRVFVNLHGPKTSYKCSKPWCDFFKGDLMSQANRQKHIDQHEFPYRCAYEDCIVGFKLGFSTEDDLQRHNGKWHALEDDANTFPKLAPSSSFSGNSDEINLPLACIRGDIERVKKLLEFDVTKKEVDKPCGLTWSGRHSGYSYPLSLAAGMGHKEICALLISHGASINIGAGVPLQKAAEHGRLEVCEFLTSNGADVNISGRPDGFRPLHLATHKGHLEICKLLMQRGAKINSKEARGGITPLHAAAEMGNIDIITLLLHQDGIETNTTSRGQRTPAQMAAAAGRTQALRIMKSSGKVDMNVGLLRLACRAVSLDTIKYLLNNGHVDEADETCVWTVLATVSPMSAKTHENNRAEAGLAMDMLFSTGNPVLSDVKRLARLLGYEDEKQLKNHKLASVTDESRYTKHNDYLKRWTEKRTPFLILIMEYPKWRIKGSAWSEFLDSKKEVGMEIYPELAKSVDKFVERIEDNRSTTIIDDEPEVKGKGRPARLSVASDDEMYEEVDDEEDESS